MQLKLFYLLATGLTLQAIEPISSDALMSEEFATSIANPEKQAVPSEFTPTSLLANSKFGQSLEGEPPADGELNLNSLSAANQEDDVNTPEESAETSEQAEIEVVSYQSPLEIELARLAALPVPPSIPLRQTTLAKAIGYIADYADMNYLYPDESVFSTVISYRSSGSPFEVLQQLAELYGFKMEFRKNTWFFFMPDIHEQIMRTYSLKYNTLEDYDISGASMGSTLSNNTSSSGIGSGSASINVITDNIVKEVKRIMDIPVDGLDDHLDVAGSVGNFASISSPGFNSFVKHQKNAGAEKSGSSPYVYYDRENNQLLINASRQQHKRVENLLEVIDRPARLIQIEVALVQTNQSPVSRRGINWSGFQGKTLNLSGLAALPFGGDVSPSNQLKDTVTLSSEDMTLLWNFIDTDSNSQILQHPTCVTLNKREIVLQVGSETPIISSTGVSSDGQISSDSNQIEYLDIGTELRAIPQTLDGGDYGELINLNFNLKFTTRSGTVNLVGNEYPTIEKRAYTNEVIVPDGATLAIGGLQQDDDIVSSTSVPVLGDLPVLGRLFKSETTERVTQNLIAFITPKIVRPKLLEDNSNRIIQPALPQSVPSLSDFVK